MEESSKIRNNQKDYEMVEKRQKHNYNNPRYSKIIAF